MSTPDFTALTAAMENLGRAFRALADLAAAVAKNFGYLVAQECGYVLRTKPLIHQGRMYRA